MRIFRFAFFQLIRDTPIGTTHGNAFTSFGRPNHSGDPERCQKRNFGWLQCRFCADDNTRPICLSMQVTVWYRRCPRATIISERLPVPLREGR